LIHLKKQRPYDSALRWDSKALRTNHLQTASRVDRFLDVDDQVVRQWVNGYGALYWQPAIFDPAVFLPMRSIESVQMRQGRGTGSAYTAALDGNTGAGTMLLGAAEDNRPPIPIT
ncbi:MAG: hypothetical protein WA317_06800, partial [Mycobacterium sp.]|uniref:hypothetical protein n=1 Tax=Mycobacterium sp. TaxID=1785 RepID=UPI003CC57640